MRNVAKVAFYEITVPPAGTAVTLDELKEYLRIDFATDDALLTSLIVAAESKIQEFTGQYFMPQTHQGNFDAIYCSEFECVPYISFTRAPLRTVVSVEVYNDTTDVYDTLPTTEWRLEQRTKGFPRIEFLDDQNITWICSESSVSYPIRITADVGYADIASVPETLKLAIKMLAAMFYENRGDCGCDGSATIPNGVRCLVSSFRIIETFG